MTSNNPRRRFGKRWQRLKADLRARRERCCRCGDAIDYTLAYPDPRSFSVDHFPYPLSTHPHMAEDPTNLRAAHLACNQANRRPQPPLGEPSEHW